jgi:hypothetical protein
VMRGQPATFAADVFSFGVVSTSPLYCQNSIVSAAASLLSIPTVLQVLWELLTWQLPWGSEGGNTWQIVGAVMAGGRLPIPPRDQLPGTDTAEFEGRLNMHLEAFALKRSSLLCLGDWYFGVRHVFRLGCIHSSAASLLGARATAAAQLPRGSARAEVSLHLNLVPRLLS